MNLNLIYFLANAVALSGWIILFLSLLFSAKRKTRVKLCWPFSNLYEGLPRLRTSQGTSQRASKGTSQRTSEAISDGASSMLGWLGGVVIPVVLAVSYALLMFVLLPFEGGGFASLEELTGFFTQPELMLLGWTHYLAFDLFVGGWQFRTGTREDMSLALLMPALLLTMILGPIGFLFFAAARAYHSNRQVPVPQRQM